MTKSARRTAKGKASASPSASSSSSSGPPPPFSKAPSTLQPFLEPLSPQEIYLIHVDTTPQDLKRQTFIIPVVINVVIVAILALRVYMARHTYPAMLATVIGFTSSMNVDTTRMSWGEMASTILRRAGSLMIDYFLVTILLPWPIRFLRGPVKWRRRVGFRDREIIVRRSQRSLTQNLTRNSWIRDNDEARDKIVAAVTPDRLRKTGYLLVDADWDLDYDAMVKAHEMLDDNLSMNEFRTAVLVNTDADGWLIWRVEDEDEDKDTVEGQGQTRSAQRDQILAFKEKLTAMGKEDLFFRWVELIQYESTLPGGFTPERQRSAMLQAKELFERENVDFARFWQEVGGMEGFTDQLD